MNTNNIFTKKRLAIGFFIFSVAASINLQGQTWQWAAKGGTPDNLDNTLREKVVSMYTAANGDTYLSSLVGRTNLDIDGNPKTTYSALGNNDMVIAAFSCDGSYKWSKVLGSYYGTSSIFLSGDASGNVYAACKVKSTAPHLSPPRQFDTDLTLPSSAVDVNTYKQTLFLIKYDTNGNFLWYRTPQADDVDRDTGKAAVPIDLEVDAAGNSYWLCSLPASSYGGGQYVTTQKGIHILKYDAEGNFIGAFQLEMSLTIAPYQFKMKRDPNNGNIYIGGENIIANGLTIGGQPVTHSKYVAAFDSSGNFLWERENSSTVSNGNGGVSFDVTVDNDGYVYFIGATGYLPSSTTPDSFNGIPFSEINSSGTWTFIVKLDSQGNTIWQTNGKSSPLLSVVVNGDELGVTGKANTLTWQNLTFQQDTNSGGHPFIARFDKSNGEIIAINGLYTTSDDWGTVITTDAYGNYYLGGQFAGSLTAGTETLNSSGGQSDFFLAKFGQSNCNLATAEFERNTIKAYPNPVRDKFFVSGASNQNYQIYNVLGMLVLSGNVQQNQAIDVEELPAGIYYLSVGDAARNQSVKILKM